MPAGRFYKKRRFYNRKKRKNYAKKNNYKYRRQIATVARPITMKPRAARQNVLYYNAFLCKPTIDSTQASNEKQQNYCITINLNSLWPFSTGYDDHSTANTQVCNPNETITTYQLPVTDGMTMMNNVRDGSQMFKQYSSCAVTGTRVTIVATPVNNDGDVQMGYLYAVKHSQPSSGLNNRSTINDINKMPYLQTAKLAGPDAPTSGFQSGQKIGAKIVTKHSTRFFNQVKDLRDNPALFNSIGSNSSAHKPNESDYLTIGCIPSLNGLDRQCTNFCLQLRIEQNLLYTEPLEGLGNAGQGNYSFPWRATLGAAATTAAGMWL